MKATKILNFPLFDFPLIRNFSLFLTSFYYIFTCITNPNFYFRLNFKILFQILIMFCPFSNYFFSNLFFVLQESTTTPLSAAASLNYTSSIITPFATDHIFKRRWRRDNVKMATIYEQKTSCSVRAQDANHVIFDHKVQWLLAPNEMIPSSLRCGWASTPKNGSHFRRFSIHNFRLMGGCDPMKIGRSKSFLVSRSPDTRFYRNSIRHPIPSSHAIQEHTCLKAY